MLKEISLDYNNKAEMLKVAKALANQARINILELLNENSLNVNEIAEKLSIPISTAASSIRILEDAGLIFTELQPGIRGSMKLCSRHCDKVLLELYRPKETQQSDTEVYSMPVGYYTDCEIHPTCGLVGKAGSIGIDDDPASFYLPEHVQAQMLWFYTGFVEYKFPNNARNDYYIMELEISFEACSEAPFYRNDWPSDITVWINDVAIGTWTSPGDLGGRRGRNNPPWWLDELNQYGILKTWKVDREHTTLDDQFISPVSIDDLALNRKPYITLRIGLSKDAKNQGGVTLFGENFGDYPQDIRMKYTFSR